LVWPKPGSLKCARIGNMKATVLKYNTVIKKEGKYFIAHVPTLGISDFGKSVEEAQENVKKAMECHIEGLLKTKTEVPEPDSQEFYVSQTSVDAPRGFGFAY